jgi:hypothetical protein
MIRGGLSPWGFGRAVGLLWRGHQDVRAHDKNCVHCVDFRGEKAGYGAGLEEWLSRLDLLLSAFPS